MSVFANGREVSGKATPNKVIAAFPSVCLSPPSPPAGPIPIPYPLFTDAGKTGDGSGSVKIKKKEVGKKNGSTYTKSQGNEPATRSFGMDVVSHTISGKNKHQAYSFDVLFEKAGAERFLDFTTTNHGSDPATAAGFDGAKAAPGSAPTTVPDCAALRSEVDGDRANAKTKATTKKQREKLTSGTMATVVKLPSGGRSYGTSSVVLNAVLDEKYHTDVNPDWQEEVDGRKKEKKGPHKSKACDGNPKIEHGGAQQGRHAEMNILEKLDWTPPGPGTLVFRIDYPNTGNKHKYKDWPCPTCQKTLRQVCACVKQIYICDERDQPLPTCPPPGPAN